MALLGAAIDKIVSKTLTDFARAHGTYDVIK